MTAKGGIPPSLVPCFVRDDGVELDVIVDVIVDGDGDGDGDGDEHRATESYIRATGRWLSVPRMEVNRVRNRVSRAFDGACAELAQGRRRRRRRQGPRQRQRMGGKGIKSM